MTIFFVVLLAVVAALAYVALRNARDFSDANEVIPGIPTSAPKAWAGAHSTEARLHRRLRDAMTALRANAALDDPALAPVRDLLQQEALAIDDRLVAAAALPSRVRDEPMRRVGEAVDAIEAAVADIVSMRGPTGTDLAAGIDAARTRLSLVAEARRELEALDPMSGRLMPPEAPPGAPAPQPPPPPPPPPPSPDDQGATEGGAPT